MSVFLYHLVCVAKHRLPAFTERADDCLREVCIEIAQRYELHFLEIGTDINHVHFLIQSVPKLSPSRLTQIIKSITARELLERVSGLREAMWGAGLWTDGYFINTVSRTGSEKVIHSYVKNQGSGNKSNYVALHKGQLGLT